MKRLIKIITGLFLLLSIITCSLIRPTQNATTPTSTPKPGRCLSAVNDARRRQWAETGSLSYVIKASENDFSVTSGTYLINVKDGQITSVDVIESRWTNYVSPADFHSFEPLTIEGMFRAIGESANGHQSETCFSTYDPKYGYPTIIQINGLCTDCGFWVTATLISLSPSSTKEP